MKYDITRLDQYLSEKFQASGFPSVTVCIRGPEGIIFEKGYGFADFNKTRPADPDTVYGIASMSKSLTALSCAILQTEGKLNFDDPVIKYFPAFRIPGTPRECVTLRHLAMHTAGVPPIAPLEWSIVMNTPERSSVSSEYLKKTAPNKMETIDQVIGYISDSHDYEPLGAPGECMSYSNDAYAILSYVVDQAAGIPLEQFLKERIFEPLGMTRSVLDLDGSEAIALAGGNITQLFDYDDNHKLYADDIWSVLPPFRGCACVKSTARDISRYYQMLAARGMFDGRQVIPAEAVDILIGHEFPETAEPFYCLGLNKRTMAGRVICEHAGGLHGVSTYGGLIMDDGIHGGYGMTALCNLGDVSTEEFQWVLYNLILGLPLETSHVWAHPVGTRFSEPEMLTGIYTSEEATPSIFSVTADLDGNLYANFDGEPQLLVYCGDTLFSRRSVSRPEEHLGVSRFLLRGGKAWAVRNYTRVYQRKA